MIAIFRNYTPFAVFLLFLLAILTRLAFVSAPVTMIADQEDYVLWNHLYGLWQGFASGSTLLNGATVLLLVIMQSLYINKIANRFDLFNNPTYLTAMTYILITGLIASWNYLSIYLVVNLLVIALFEMCLRLYEGYNNPFLFVNIGMISACIALLFWPGLLYFIMAIIALLIFRSFRVIEWVRLLFGFATPYYLLFGVLYVNDKSKLIPQIFSWDIDWIMPKANNQYIIIGACTLLVFIIVGSYYLQRFMERMVIHTKRFWWVVLLYFACSLLILPLTLTSDWSNALLLAPSLTLCINNIWLAHRRKWIPNVMLVMLICLVIALQWRVF